MALPGRKVRVVYYTFAPRFLSFLVVFCCCCPSALLMARGESSTNAAVVSPIGSFGPSWAASSAHGTTIAVPCSLVLMDEGEEETTTDAVILLLRSGKSSSTSPWKITTKESSTEETQFTIGGLRITGPVHHSSDSSILAGQSATGSKRSSILGSTVLCSMTGLASDIDYITSLVQKQVDDHRYIYDGASLAQTLNMPASEIIRILSDVLIGETLYQGQRPLGVQALVVGYDPKSDGKSHGTTPVFNIFTLDPSGGYRHWAVGQRLDAMLFLCERSYKNICRARKPK